MLWNRYCAPTQLVEVVRVEAKAKVQQRKQWRIEDSCWRKRSAWADSGSFLDTEETYRKAFRLDWARALRSHGLAAYICKHDDGESDEEEEQGAQPAAAPATAEVQPTLQVTAEATAGATTAATAEATAEAAAAAASSEASPPAATPAAAAAAELAAADAAAQVEPSPLAAPAVAAPAVDASETAEVGEELWKHHLTLYRNGRSPRPPRPPAAPAQRICSQKRPQSSQPAHGPDFPSAHPATVPARHPGSQLLGSRLSRADRPHSHPPFGIHAAADPGSSPGAFDAYSAIGAGSGDFSHMAFSGFQRFVEDCKLTEKGSRHCSKAHVDQLFLMVNTKERPKGGTKRSHGGGVGAAPAGKGAAGAAGGGMVDEEDDPADEDLGPARALDRQEWMQCLVRLAIMRYVCTRRIADVSTAVGVLFDKDIKPNLGGAALQDSNDFRQQACYNEETDAVLLEHLPSLRALFRAATKLDGFDSADRQASSLLSFPEWTRFVKALELIDAEFTAREASLAFTWSRMRVVDEGAKKSKAKLESLSFEDFFEALVHVATMKV